MTFPRVRRLGQESNIDNTGISKITSCIRNFKRTIYGREKCKSWRLWRGLFAQKLTQPSQKTWKTLVERLPAIIIFITTIMITKGFVWSGWEVACRISSVCSPPLHCALFASTASRYLPQSNRGQLIMNYLLFGLFCFSAGTFLGVSWWGDRYSPYRLRQTVTQICLHPSNCFKQSS